MQEGIASSEIDLVRAEFTKLLAEAKGQARTQVAKALVAGVVAALVAASSAIWAWAQTGGPARAIDAATQSELKALKSELDAHRQSQAWVPVTAGPFNPKCEYRFLFSSGNPDMPLFGAQVLRSGAYVYLEQITPNALYIYASSKRLEVQTSNVKQVNLDGAQSGVIDLESRCVP